VGRRLERDDENSEVVASIELCTLGSDVHLQAQETKSKRAEY
jgi:hypothetical protein